MTRGAFGIGSEIVSVFRGLGGSIHLMSAPSKGTTFQILLPCAETGDPATNDAVSGIEEPARPSQPRTVLLVEDESPLRRAVGEMLRRRGFEVFEGVWIGQQGNAARLAREGLRA